MEVKFKIIHHYLHLCCKSFIQKIKIFYTYFLTEHSENSDICSEKDFFEKISSNNFVKISKHLPKDDVSPCSLKSPFSSKSLISEDWFDFQDQQFSVSCFCHL